MPTDRERRFRLRNLEVDRVDLVDRGANQLSHVVFAKAAGAPVPAPAQPKPPAPAAPAAPAAPGAPGAPPRLQRFTPDQFEMTLDSPNHKEWSLKADALPEGFEDISITMFSEGENQRFQWMIDPIDGPPQMGDAKTAAEALTALRSASTATVAGTQAGLSLPSAPPATPGAGLGAGAAPSAASQPAPAKAPTPPPGKPPIANPAVAGSGAADGQSLLDRLRQRLAVPGTPGDTMKPKPGSPGKMSATAKSADAPQEVTMDIDALADTIPDEVLDYIDDLESRLAAATAVTKSEGDPIAKALESAPAELVEVFKSQQAALAETQAALRTEQIAKADSVWIMKARSLDGIVDSPESFGPKLRAVADMDAALADEVLKALEVANTRLAKGALFSERGHAAPAPGSVEERVASLAAENIAKGMDPAAARAEVWESNPDLYEQYINESRATRP